MAYGWSVQPSADNEAAEWTSALDQSALNSDQTSWRVKASVLSPNATAATGIINFGGWTAEDLFNATPEEFDDLTPEETQSDQDDWTVVGAPD